MAIALVVAAFAGLLAGMVKVFDFDSFHHLAMGRHIARQWWATEEPFLFPLAGARIGPVPYWLGSLAIYGWHTLAGDQGMPLLPGLVGAALLVILLLDSSPRGRTHDWLTVAAGALPLSIAAIGFRYRAVGRPELFATLLIALTAWSIRRSDEGRPRLLLAFPLLALIWTNMHASVLGGIGLLLGAWADALLTWLRVPPPDRRSSWLRAPHFRLILVAAAGLATGALNPSPANPIGTAFRFVGTAFGRHLDRGKGDTAAEAVIGSVVEMRGLNLHFFVEPFGVLLVLTLAVLLLRWRHVRLWELLAVAGFALLTLAAARFGVMLAIVCAPIAARHLGGGLAAFHEKRSARSPATVAVACWVVTAAAGVPLFLAEPGLCGGFGTVPGIFPERGVRYLKGIGFDGPLFNTFHFGGFVEWNEIAAPYQDGRGAVPPGEAGVAMRGTLDRRGFEILDSKYRFDALLLGYPHDSPAASARFNAAFGASDWGADRKTWALVAFDDAGLLYLRRDGKYAAAAARDEFRFAKPANAVLSPRPEELPGLLADFRRSVDEAPACALCRYYQAVAALSVGLGQEALQAVAPVRQAGCGATRLPIGEVIRQAAIASSPVP